VDVELLIVRVSAPFTEHLGGRKPNTGLAKSPHLSGDTLLCVYFFFLGY